MTIKTIARAAAVATVAALLYRKLLRQPILTWGATAEEAEARLPGDELLETADGMATPAITVNAPASAVWPWIAQMGLAHLNEFADYYTRLERMEEEARRDWQQRH